MALLWIYRFTLLRFDLFVGFTSVTTHIISRRKSLVAEVTGNTYSIQMISFNVSSYVIEEAFLATNFANA